MKEVIEEILLVEKEARKRVEEARQKAKEIVLNAETEAKALRQESSEKAAEEARKLLAESEEKAQKQKEATLDSAKSEGDSLWTDNKDKIDRTVGILVERFLNQE